jgi:hypothetical protein
MGSLLIAHAIYVLCVTACVIANCSNVYAVLQMGVQGHYMSDYHVRVPTLRVRRDW